MKRFILLFICAAIISSLFAPVAMAKAPTSIALAQPTITLAKTKKLSLAGDVTIEPAGASRSFTWKSSNSKVVSVSTKGVLTANKTGVATITVQAKNNKAVSASCQVTVRSRTAMEYNPKKGNYKAGNNNAYGVWLNQSDLNKLKKEVDRVIAMIIQPGMKDYQKLNAIGYYITSKTTYADWRTHRYNNTACGPLLRGTGACSGFARTFKALCDAVDIPCYHLHSTIGSPHQWNMVRLDGIWFHIDVLDPYYGAVRYVQGWSVALPAGPGYPPCTYDLIYPSKDPNQPVREDYYDKGSTVHVDSNGNPIPAGTYTFENAPRI